MNYKCKNCQVINEVPKEEDASQYRCYECGSQLVPEPISNGNTSAAVGIIGGAALGASVGGPVGAVIGGIVGGIIGKESKGIG